MPVLVRKRSGVTAQVLILALVWVLTCAGAVFAQVTESGAVSQKENFANCLKGLVRCDFSRLSSAEVALIAEAYRKFHFEACKSGLSTCDPVRLTKEELELTQTAARRRNLERCLT